MPNINGVMKYWPVFVTVAGVIGASAVVMWRMDALADGQKVQDAQIDQNTDRSWSNGERLSVLESEVKTNLNHISKRLSAQSRTLERLDRKIDRLARPPRQPDWP